MKSLQRGAGLVAVVGDARLEPGDRRQQLARLVGRNLIDAGFRVLTGGLGGVMEAASAGAHESANYVPGAVVGLLPGRDPEAANPYVDVVIPTGLDLARNTIVANADAVIAIGGGSGTLSEIAIAWQLHRLIVALRVDGWSGELADRRIDRRVRYTELPEDRVYGAETADDAVDLVVKLLPAYRRRHRGV